MPLSIIDAHVHFWDPGRRYYGWLADVPALDRPFLPADFLAAAPACVQRMVFVECDAVTSPGIDEAAWITQLAAGDSRLAGIVARACLERGPAVRDELESLAQNPRIKGVRRNLQGETDDDFCLQPRFVAGVRALADFGLACDLCIAHRQLPAVTKLVRQCPEVRFVLDHAGKPPIRQHVLDPWRGHLREFAALPNAWCKLSGLATEADWAHWQPDDLRPYVAHVLACFGFDRVLFGGDWPVVTLACDYPRWLDTLQFLLAGASEGEFQKLFCENAAAFYRL